MTELEAKQYISELQRLNKTYERLGKCQINMSVEEVYKGQKLAWVKVKDLSLKVD
jgi:hypothetical protein